MAPGRHGVPLPGSGAEAGTLDAFIGVQGAGVDAVREQAGSPVAGLTLVGVVGPEVDVAFGHLGSSSTSLLMLTDMMEAILAHRNRPGAGSNVSLSEMDIHLVERKSAVALATTEFGELILDGGETGS